MSTYMLDESITEDLNLRTDKNDWFWEWFYNYFFFVDILAKYEELFR